MNLLRTEQQLALNDLLVETIATIDHDRDAAEFLENSEISSELRGVADEREAFRDRLQQLIKDLGDLPSEPDPDRETGEKLLNRASAALSSDDIADVLERRLIAEQHLARKLAESRRAGLSEPACQLVEELAQHIEEVTARLQERLSGLRS